MKSFLERFSRLRKDMIVSEIISCLFGGTATVPSIEEKNVKKQSALDVTPTKPKRKLDKDDTSEVNTSSSMQTSFLEVSPEAYKTLMENLFMSKLWFLRARNITMNQLNVYKEEAIGHMREIKCIIHEELENPEVSAKSLAQELVETGATVIRYQQALNKIEMEELVKNMDSLLDTLSYNVREIKNLVRPKIKKESKQRPYMKIIFNYGRWCLLVLYVSIMVYLTTCQHL